MKFIVVTDTHGRVTNPTYRVGSFRDHIKKKIETICKIAQDIGARFIVHGGDLFDSARVPLSFVDEIVDIMERYMLVWYIVRGNHDQVGNNSATSQNSILDHLFRRSDYIKHADKWVCEYAGKDEEPKRCCFVGYDYYTDIEVDLKKDGLFYDAVCKGSELKCDYYIAIVHAIIAFKKVPDYLTHVTIDELKTNYDVICIGHYHYPQGICKKDNTIYVAPGACARLSATKENIGRIPQIAVFDLNKRTVELMPLPDSNSGCEVFDVERAQSTKMFNESMRSFIDTLEEYSDNSFDLDEILRDILKSEKIEKPIVDEIKKRLCN